MSSHPILSYDDSDSNNSDETSSEMRAPTSDCSSDLGVGVSVTTHGVVQETASPGPPSPSAGGSTWLALRERVGPLVVTPLLPDEGLSVMGLELPVFHVRLLKFAAASLALFVLAHWQVRANDWSHNPQYDLQDWALYDCSSCVLDMFWFFVVGRFWCRRGVDTPLFLFGSLLGAWIFSVVDEPSWAKYSLSKYDIYCRWPLALFLFAFMVVFVVTSLAGLHVVRGVRDGILFGRVFEVAFAAAAFVLPVAFDESAHYHHWFTAWFVGQHANQPYWWSVMCSALLWGGYVQGISAWGRGAMLGCKAAFWMSGGSQYCTYLDCYVHPSDDGGDDDGVQPIPVPFVPLDWQNCSAAGS